MNRTEGLNNMMDVFVLISSPLSSIVGVQLSLKICEQELPGPIQLTRGTELAYPHGAQFFFPNSIRVKHYLALALN